MGEEKGGIPGGGRINYWGEKVIFQTKSRGKTKYSKKEVKVSLDTWERGDVW